MRRTLIESGIGAIVVRFLTARRLRALMTAAGVALGVGLAAAISIMGMTLQAALADQQRLSLGTYNLAVFAEGRLLTAEEVRTVRNLKGLGQIRAEAGALLISPGSAESQGVPLTTDYLGVAPTPRGEFAYALVEGRYPGMAEFVASLAVVDHLGVKLGDSISLPFKNGEQQVRLVGIRTAIGGGLGESSNAYTFDLSWLQKQMGLGDSVSSLLIWSQEAKQLVAEVIKHQAPELLPVIRSEMDVAENGISLVGTWATMLGLAAFLAAFFMVAGTFHIAVRERIHELSMLRAIGAMPAQVMRLVLQEAAVLGTVGSLGGLLAGIGVSQLSLRVASASFGVPSRPLTLPVIALAAEAVGGILLAIVAARGAAKAAGQIRPLEAIRPSPQTHFQPESTELLPGGLLMILGLLVAPVGLLMTGGSGWRALVSTAGGLAFVIGLIKALPHFFPKITGLLAVPLGKLFPVEVLIAARSVVRHRRRSALTVTTLLLGVMLLSSVGTILVEVTAVADEQLHRRFASDAIITSSASTHLGFTLVERIAALPGVSLTVPVAKEINGIIALWDWNKADQIWLQGLQEQESRHEIAIYTHKRVSVVGADLDVYARVVNLTIHGDPSKGATMTVEAARNRGIELGDTVPFVSLAQTEEAAQGKEVTPKPLVVTALVDEWPELPANTIVVPRATVNEPDETIYFNYDPARRTETINAVRLLLDHPRFGMAEMRVFAEEQEESRRQSVQVWSILGAVAIVIFVVATISLVNVTIAGIQARRRELATIRAVGSTPVQTVRQVVLEAALMGIVGSLLGLICAFVFTSAAYIGLDSIPHTYAPGLYVGCLIGGPLLGAAAALVPARRISQGSVSEVLRFE